MASKSIYLTLGDSIELDRSNPEGTPAGHANALHHIIIIIIITLTTIRNELARPLAAATHAAL